jgi:hypothetical protein
VRRPEQNHGSLFPPEPSAPSFGRPLVLPPTSPSSPLRSSPCSGSGWRSS